VWHTSVFDVEHVRVRGEKALTAAQITGAAKVPQGVPLESLNVDAVTRRVAAVPRVASVSVSRSFPHTVVISVTERQAAALVPVPGGYDEIDLTGVTFATVKAQVAGVPIITIAPSLGTSARAAIVTGTLAALRALPAALAARVQSVTGDDMYGITLNFPGGVTVDWGGGDNSAEKAHVLAALMKQAHAHYDVSAPSAPAVSG
jgi:cell division protein FtsQ